MELIGGILYIQMHDNKNMGKAYRYFSGVELISELIMIVGICLSIKRTMKTVR